MRLLEKSPGCSVEERERNRVANEEVPERREAVGTGSGHFCQILLGSHSDRSLEIPAGFCMRGKSQHGGL
jgi:hypothetical protein